MKRKIRSYESEELVVEFDAKRCIHAARCVRGLPAVFDADKRPWIDPRQASGADIARVIEECPTGALHYRWLVAGKPEKPNPTNCVSIGEDGPLYCSGDLTIAMPDGAEITETRAALCRCGHSRDKPFCDNSHIEAGFTDSGEVPVNNLKPAASDEPPTVNISPSTNGPILVRGPLEIKGADGSRATGSMGALCRCGHSANKPYCDGAHKAAGFEAP